MLEASHIGDEGVSYTSMASSICRPLMNEIIGNVSGSVPRSGRPSNCDIEETSPIQLECPS